MGLIDRAPFVYFCVYISIDAVVTQDPTHANMRTLYNAGLWWTGLMSHDGSHAPFLSIVAVMGI